MPLFAYDWSRGALVSSSIIAAATLLLAIAGIVISFRKSLGAQAWEKPKELRLMHFAFWFFVAVSVYSWISEGATYEGGKTLGTHARFILFWPLIIALSYARIRAKTFFRHWVSCPVSNGRIYHSSCKL